MENQLTDNIYIFISPDLPGIKFSDNSSIEALAELPFGVFDTFRSTISSVTWDDNVNEKNRSKILPHKYGHQLNKTYIVSEEKFKEILIYIEKNQNLDILRIDTREINKNYQTDFNDISDKKIKF